MKMAMDNAPDPTQAFYTTPKRSKHTIEMNERIGGSDIRLLKCMYSSSAYTDPQVTLLFWSQFMVICQSSDLPCCFLFGVEVRLQCQGFQAKRRSSYDFTD